MSLLHTMAVVVCNIKGSNCICCIRIYLNGFSPVDYWLFMIVCYNIKEMLKMCSYQILAKQPAKYTTVIQSVTRVSAVLTSL